MSWKDSYNARINYHGTTEQERLANEGIQTFKDFLMNAPNRKTIIIEDEDYFGVIQDVAFNDNNKDNKILLVELTTPAEVGVVFECEGIKWLITGEEKNTIVTHRTFKVTECNNTLKFYKNSILRTIPCIVTSGSGNYMDEDINKFMSLPNGRYLCICPSGTITKEDTNLRFIMNDAPYKINGIDNLKSDGLIYMELNDDVFTANDNRALGIADYYSNQPNIVTTILNGESATLLYTSSILQLNVQCKENGVIIDNPTITYTTNNNLIATVSSTGLITAIGTGDCIVTATYKGVSDTISIHGDISVPTNYVLTLTPTDTTLKLGRTLELTAHAFNNGIEDLTRHFNWIITNVDGSTNSYVVATPNDKTCTLVASTSSNYANKYINVKAELSYNSAIFVERQIKLLSLI